MIFMSSMYHTGQLPSLANLAATASQMEPVEHVSRRPQLPSLATTGYGPLRPTSPYNAPSPHYSSSQNSTSVSSVAFLTSAGDSRRPCVEEKNTTSSRLSLPSISEALANTPTQNPPPSAISLSQSYFQQSPPSPQSAWRPPPADLAQYSHTRPSPRDPRPPRASYMGSNGPATPRTSTAYLPRSYTPKMEPTEYPFETSQSYTASQPLRRPSPPSKTVHQWSAQPSISQQPFAKSSDQETSRHNLPQYAQELYATSAPPPQELYPFAPHHPAVTAPDDAWRQDRSDNQQFDASKKDQYSYGDSVKRHLDYFDLESAWHDIAGSSHQAFEIAQHYENRAHEIQNPGTLPGYIATIAELDTIIRNASIMSESASRMREIAISHEAELAAHAREQGLNKSVKHGLVEDTQDGSRESGYGGSDPKKPRRGRAAPPGRCHSCNRAETPEWRRGPDGARTLCNACGLHYAKLTRKQGAQKQPLGNSSLRSTCLDAASPGV